MQRMHQILSINRSHQEIWNESEFFLFHTVKNNDNYNELINIDKHGTFHKWRNFSIVVLCRSLDSVHNIRCR